jgi:hypothetical protein
MREPLRDERPRRARDLALILPFIGLVALIPPLIGLFAGGSLSGVPLILAYLFGVWLALILAALMVARRLKAPG